MEKQVITKQAVYRVLQDYWVQYKKHIAWAVMAFFMPAIGTVLMFFVPPLIIAKVVNTLAAEHTMSTISIITFAALFGGFWFVGDLFWRFGVHFLIKLEATGLSDLGKQAFNRLTDRDYDFYTNNFVGSLTKKASAFSRGFETFTDTMVFSVLTNIFPIIFAVIILARYSLWIPLILLASIAVAITVAVPIIRNRAKLVALRHEAGSKVAGRMSDSITNMLAVKSFAKETQEQKTFGEHVDDFSAKFKKAANYQNLRFDLVMSPMYVVTNIIGFVVAIFFTQTLGLEAGTIVVVFSYYSQITRIFWDINRVYRNLESSISEAAEFTQLLIDPPAVQDAPDAKHLSVGDANIHFSDVNFKYESGTSAVAVTTKGASATSGEKSEKTADLFLRDFNLDIKAKQRVGLVGPSGGGKTTITKLLLRFIDLESGKIMIDGQDISQVSQKSLREAMAYVPQEPLLFHRSLFENIAYGNENATKEEVVKAAKLARADEFIDKLPKGYDTLVGERGIKLSGGQRQRIAIARALLKKAPILVLDEATSSLDSESEKYIQEGLWELMKDKTALVIAHRLSTIKHLDRIIVLEQGKIVQDGTHDELIKQKGLYAKLWSHQSGEFLED